MTCHVMKATIADFMALHGFTGTPIVGAGSAMWLHGLRENTRDIDLYLPTMDKFHVESRHNGIVVDAHNNWEIVPGLSERVERGVVTIQGLRVMGLVELLETYRALNRPKDQTSIEVLEAVLTPSGQPLGNGNDGK